MGGARPDNATGATARRRIVVAVVLGALVSSFLSTAPAGPASAVVSDLPAVTPGTIDTVAGSGGEGPALGLGMRPVGIASTPTDLIVVDGNNRVIRRIDKATGEATVIAGTDGASKRPPGPSTLATEVDLSDPREVAVDPGGRTVFISAVGNSRRLQRIEGDGTIEEVAAYSWPIPPGYVMQATAVTSSAAGLYYAGTDEDFVKQRAKIVHVRPDGSVEVIDQQERDYEWGTSLESAGRLAATDDGTVYFSRGGRVWSLVPGSAPVAVAGTGALFDSTGDGGPAIDASFRYIAGLAVDGDGILVNDGEERLRRVAADHTISTIALSGLDDAGDGGPLSSARFGGIGPLHVDGPIRYVGTRSRLRRYGGDDVVHTVAGNGSDTFGGDGGPATRALLRAPADVLAMGDGSVAIADAANGRIRRVAPDGTISTLLEESARRLVLAPDGAIVFSDSVGRVRRRAADGAVTTLAGGGNAVLDGVPATTARLDAFGLAYDGAGRLLIADQSGGKVRRVEPDQTIVTVAGTGATGFSGDGGPATAASFSHPRGLAIDAAGNLYVGDTDNDRVRKIDGSGTITTYAGGGRPANPSIGDSGPATLARVTKPVDLSLRGTDLLVLSGGVHPSPCEIQILCNGSYQLSDNRVRRVDASGTISTLVGNNYVGGLEGDGGPSGSAALYGPSGIGVTAAGTLLIADSSNNRVRAAPPITVPAPPGNVAANQKTDGTTHVAVSWTAPDDGGSPITGYVVTAQPGNHTCAPVGVGLTCDLDDLALGSTYQVTVTAANAIGPATSNPVPVTIRSYGSRYNAVSPERLVDTRDGTGGSAQPLGPGETRNVRVTGGEVPEGADAVVLTVTAVGPTQDTHLSLYPAGQPMPTASNLNPAAGQTVANTVIATVGVDGDISVFNNAGLTPVVIDITGYYEKGFFGGGYRSSGPTRVYDSRQSQRFGAGETREVFTDPTGVLRPDAVVMTVTVVNPSAATHLTVWHSGAPQPSTSNLNAPAGAVVANTMIVDPDSYGVLQVRNNAGTADVLVDVLGVYDNAPSRSTYHPSSPRRLVDSRDGTGGYPSAWPAATTREVEVTGDGVPDDAVAVVLTVTVVQPSDWTHVTVWPGGQPTPGISSVNAARGKVVANTVIVGVGSGGKIQVYNNAGQTHLVIDVSGYYR